MLPHPGSSDISCDSTGVLDRGEQENEDEMRLVDLHDVSREPTPVDDLLHHVLRGANLLLRKRIAEAQMVDDDVHGQTVSRCAPARSCGGRPHLQRR